MTFARSERMGARRSREAAAGAWCGRHLLAPKSRMLVLDRTVEKGVMD
jgi:hypothetical protein